MTVRFGSAILLAALLVTGLAAGAHAEPQRGLPWPRGITGKQNVGNSYDCGTHDVMNGSEWSFYAIDFALLPLGAGEEITASSDGRIVERTRHPEDGSAWGNSVTIDHGGSSAAMHT